MRRFRLHKKYKRFRRARRLTGKRVARIARRVIRNEAETKFYFQSLGVTTVTTTVQFVKWADGLAQGLLATNRIGSQVRAKNLSFRFQIGFNPSSDSPTSQVRIINVRLLVLYPRKGVDDTEMLASNAGLNMVTRPEPQTTIVMYDKTFTFGWNDANAGWASWGGHPFLRFVEFNKRFPYNFNYGPASTTVERQPIVVFISSQSAVNQGDMPCIIAGYTCMSFKDM